MEDADTHYYQPLWTLVGGGIKKNTESAKPMKDVIPKGVNWIKNSAEEIQPNENKIVLNDGTNVDYDYLVVAAGVTTKWDSIPGLKAGIESEIAGKNSGVVSIYDYKYSPYVFNHFGKFRSGKAIFTLPNTPIKCPGAPQKIMWLLEEYARENGFRQDVEIDYRVPGGAMFGVQKYADMLAKEAETRNINTYFKMELVSVDGDAKKATFKNVDTGEVTTEGFEMLHVAPPMGPPSFLKKSPSLVNEAGFLNVDKHSLQSVNHSNVFGIGDCMNTTNSKSAAAITSQAPVVVHNLIKSIKSGGKAKLDAHYSGYGSCPLIIGKGKVILAEFGYDGKIMETFCRDNGKFPYNLVGSHGDQQMKLFYFLKETVFPMAYWDMYLKGNWFGPCGPFKPDVVKSP